MQLLFPLASVVSGYSDFPAPCEKGPHGRSMRSLCLVPPPRRDTRIRMSRSNSSQGVSQVRKFSHSDARSTRPNHQASSIRVKVAARKSSWARQRPFVGGVLFFQTACDMHPNSLGCFEGYVCDSGSMGELAPTLVELRPVAPVLASGHLDDSINLPLRFTPTDSIAKHRPAASSRCLAPCSPGRDTPRGSRETAFR